MKTLGLLACGAAVAALASTAHAGPMGATLLQGLTADMGLIEPVHGCHREVLLDRRGWHYHRRNCGRVNVPPPGYGPYGPNSPGVCFWAGPVWVCP